MRLEVVQPARLSAIASRWTIEAIGTLPPAELLSTCHDCVQVREGEYHPATKCCTYLPTLRNFQVGALLDDPQVSAAGRASVEARIAAGRGVTPYGLEGPNWFDALDYRGNSFGRDPALRCPHYLESGDCGVYQHRNATCSTWFCRFDRGEASWDFWSALHSFLVDIEDTLANWAIDELGAADGFGGKDPRAFYRACTMAVGFLTWDQIRTLGGDRLDALASRTRQLHETLLAAPLHLTGKPRT